MWKWELVGKLLRSVNGKPYQIQASEYHDHGRFEVVDQGKNAIVGYSDIEEKLFKSIPIIVFGDHTTALKYRDRPFIVGGDGVKLLTSCSDKISLKYLFYALLRYGPRAEGYKRHYTMLKEKSVPIPLRNEQDVLASFLSLIDRRITAQRKLVELLKKHKKGVIEQIFGQSNMGWKRCHLGDIAVVNPSTGTLPIEFYYMDLESVSEGVWEKRTLVQREDAPSRAQRNVVLGDILFQTVRPYQQNNYFIESELDKPIVASTGYAQIRTSEVPLFVYWMLHSQSFFREVLSRCTGSSYPAVNASDLEEIDISVPGRVEQIHYATLLAQIAKRCEIEIAIDVLLEELKRGLLQALFV